MPEILIPLSGHPSLTFNYAFNNPLTAYVSGTGSGTTGPGDPSTGTGADYTYPTTGNGAYRSVFPSFSYNGNESGTKSLIIQFQSQFTFNGGNNDATFFVPGQNALGLEAPTWGGIASFLNASYPSFPPTQTGNSFSSTATAGGQAVNISFGASYAPEAAETDTGGSTGDTSSNITNTGQSPEAAVGTPNNTRLFSVQLLNGGQYNTAPFAPIEVSGNTWKAGSFDVEIDLDDYPALDQSTLGRNGPILHGLTLNIQGGSSFPLIAAPVKTSTWYLTASNTFVGSSTSLFELVNNIVNAINSGNTQVRAEIITSLGGNNFRLVNNGNLDLSVITLTWDVEGRWALLDEQNTLGVGTVWTNGSGERRTFTQNYNIDGRFTGTGLLNTPIQRDQQQIGDDIFAVSDEDCNTVEAITDIILDGSTTGLLRIRRGQAEIKSIYQKFRGRLINVPTEFDPVARTYTAQPDFANPTFKQVYSNDPAWCFYDYLKDTEFGCGNFLALTATQEADLLEQLYKLSLRNNEVVNDSYRSTINGTISGDKTKVEVLEAIAASMFARPIFYNGVQLVADIPQDPKVIFNTSNVIFQEGKEAFQYTGSSDKTNLNEVVVKYQDEKRIKLKNSVTVRADNDPFNFGTSIVESPLGVNNRQQAIRYGKSILYNNSYADILTVTFETGSIGNMLFVGDIILIPEDQFVKEIQVSTTIDRLYDIPGVGGVDDLCVSAVVNIEILNNVGVNVNQAGANIGTVEWYEIDCVPTVIVKDISLNNTEVDAEAPGATIGTINITTGLINGN